MTRRFHAIATEADQPQRGDQISHRAGEIPAVCFMDDVCRILRVSRATVKRLRRHRAFPIPELPALDKRPRWSGEAVRRYLEGQGQLSRRRSA